MYRKRIKAVVVLLLFLIAGVFYSTDRNQDFFVEESSQETGAFAAGELQFDETSSDGSSKTSSDKSKERSSVTSSEDSKESMHEAGSVTGSEENVPLLRVHVCGAVKHAGVYRLEAHSIVADAVASAGGFKKGSARDYLNLAAEVADGDKIYVPYKKELEADGYAGSGTLKASSTGPGNLTDSGHGQDPDQGLVNINTADESLLTTLSGIGSARAQSIINWRNEHGAFTRTEDIMQVSGIKEAAYAKIKDFICV